MNNQTAKEELAHWDKLLDEYESSIGLPVYQADGLQESQLQSYLQMSRDKLEKLGPHECAEVAYILGQFSFHTQRTANRETARLNWADETIKEVIADEINNYKGYGYIEKSMQAIKHNEKASKLNRIKRYAKQRVDRLCYLSNSIKNLSDILLSIQRAKMVKQNG